MHQGRGAIVIHGVHVSTRLNQFPDLRVIAVPDGYQQIGRTRSEQHGAGREQTRHNEMMDVDSPYVLLEWIVPCVTRPSRRP